MMKIRGRGQKSLSMMDERPILRDDLRRTHFQNTMVGGNTDEGLNSMGESFFDSVAIVKRKVLLCYVKPEEGGRRECFGGNRGGRGIIIGERKSEGASQGHDVEPLRVVEAVVVGGDAVLEVAVGERERKTAIVVGGGVPENGVEPRVGLVVE